MAQIKIRYWSIYSSEIRKNSKKKIPNTNFRYSDKKSHQKRKLEGCDMTKTKITELVTTALKRVTALEKELALIRSILENGAIVRKWVTDEDPVNEDCITATKDIKVNETDIPIALQKRTKCFIGNEMEGPHKGKRVLFIPGSVTPERMRKAWHTAEGTNADRVYFGAGNDLDLDMSTLSLLVSNANLSKLDIECRWMTSELVHAKKLGATVICRTNDSRASFYKIIREDEVEWTIPLEGERHPSNETNDSYITKLNDPGYEKDRYVE